jgi:predicted O-methyltransferase YrrM
MNCYEKLYFIKQYTDSIGSIYGTEDFAIFLYSLIKMRKSKTVVELGTGLGSIMLWSALALQENNSGHFYTVDNGSEWPSLKAARPQMGPLFREEYADYINNLINYFKLSDSVTFINNQINLSNLPNNIDIIFSDFAHGPKDIVSMLPDMLLKCADSSVIMFDSASTYYSSYHTLEAIVALFNAGKIPASMKSSEQLQKKISTSKFTIQHMLESKPRAQNSTACLYIDPIDILPHPLTNMRF